MLDFRLQDILIFRRSLLGAQGFGELNSKKSKISIQNYKTQSYYLTQGNRWRNAAGSWGWFCSSACPGSPWWVSPGWWHPCLPPVATESHGSTEHAEHKGMVRAHRAQPPVSAHSNGWFINNISNRSEYTGIYRLQNIISKSEDCEAKDAQTSKQELTGHRSNQI